jgi:hypothetical protein
MLAAPEHVWLVVLIRKRCKGRAFPRNDILLASMLLCMSCRKTAEQASLGRSPRQNVCRRPTLF